MRFIHTFYSKPLLNNKFNKFETLLDVILTDYAYSAACVQHHGYEIILYADKVGAEMLSHIPYNKVIVIDFNESVDFAASIKFEAIKNMTKEDVLIDGDLFLQKRLVFDILEEYASKYDFIYSFFEPYEYTVLRDMTYYINYYGEILSKMSQKKELFTDPYTLPRRLDDLSWPNTSLMMFGNDDLRKEYMRQYLFFKENLKDIDFQKGWPDIIIEQYHMKRLLAHGSYTSKAITENFPTEESNNYSLKVGFTHLGAAKVKFNDMFRNKLAELDPILSEATNGQIDKYKTQTKK